MSVIALLACDGGDRAPGGSAGLVTVFDSTADTIVARVDGAVPVSALRVMDVVMRIAPAMDDTSLFGVVGEVDVDVANRVWLYDYQASQLFLFDSGGTLVRRIGRKGAGPGEFADGSGLVTLADTGAAVWDPRNGRISFFTASGEFRTTWPSPTGFFTSDGLVTDRSHALYLRRPVTPPREGEILGRMGLVRLKEGGALGDSLLPVDLPVTRDTYSAVSTDGRSRSSTPSSFAPNYFWDWHPDGFFVTGHGGRYELILERRGAKPIVIRRSAPPVPVLPDERSEEKERITWSMRQTQPGWAWNGPEIPGTKAPLMGLFIARDGNIWARVATASQRIPEDELAPQRENGPPVRHFRTPAVYEVFAPDGRFLGRVPLPPRTTLVQAHGRSLWAVMRDADDLSSIVRFRMNESF